MTDDDCAAGARYIPAHPLFVFTATPRFDVEERQRMTVALLEEMVAAQKPAPVMEGPAT